MTLFIATNYSDLLKLIAISFFNLIKLFRRVTSFVAYLRFSKSQSLQRIKIVSRYILVLSSYLSRFIFISLFFPNIIFHSWFFFFFFRYYTLPPLRFFNFLVQRYFCHVPHFLHYFIIFICFFHSYVSRSDQFLIFLIIQPFYQDTHFSRTFSFLPSGHSYPPLWIYLRICIFVSFLFLSFPLFRSFFFLVYF